MIVTGGHLERPIDVLCDGADDGNVRRRAREEPEHARLRLHVFVRHRGAAGRRASSLRDAVILAKAYVTKAIEKSYPIGKGAGPLNQLFRFHQEPPPRGVHEVPQHGMHPAAEPAAH